MKNFSKSFKIKKNRLIPVDKFIEKVLYKPNIGYYSKKNPFGHKGDFITAPTISNLFSEIIGIWIISSWEKLGKPKKFNFVELGPGDGSLTKVLINTFKNFPELELSIKIFLYEKSKLLRNIQKKKLTSSKVKWIKNFNQIKSGPTIFFGNEFFDAIPIKQFKYEKKLLFEKCFIIDRENKVNEKYKKTSFNNKLKIESFKNLNNLEFIEYPKLGFEELNKIIKIISKLSGGILLIDYGYVNKISKNTIQAVMKNKKIPIKKLLKNLGKADITSLVNFSLLREYFEKNNLKVKEIVSQKFFLERMGIIERANILKEKMNRTELDYMSSTLKRLLDKELMGELFKVIFAYKSKENNFLGFK